MQVAWLLRGLLFCLFVAVALLGWLVAPPLAASDPQPGDGVEREADADASEGEANNNDGGEADEGPSPDEALTALRRRFGDDYEYTVDRQRRLIFATNQSEALLDYLAERLAAFSDALREYCPHELDGYVSVVFPSAAAFREMQPSEHIGGWYEGGQSRALICMNLSYTLQHEFIHAIQFDDMRARGVWLNRWFWEGIAVCFEDAAITADGSLEPVRSARMSILKRMNRGRDFIPLAELLAMDSRTFQQRHEHAYPASGYFLHWLWELGKLREVYDAYAETHETCNDGIHAVEQVLEMSLDEVEQQWRRWIREQPEAQPLNYQPARLPYLGIQGRTEPRGLQVTRVAEPARGAGVRRRDIVLAVDSVAISDQAKLNQALERNNVGDEVEVVLLRGNNEIVRHTVRLARRR